MKKAIIAATFVFVFIAGMLSAQMVEQAEIKSIKEDYLGLTPVNKPFSLIDISRIKLTHSYSLSFFSGGGRSSSVGMYTGNIFYAITPSLSLDVAVGIAHNPGALFNQNTQTNAHFFPAVELNYHPSEKFKLSVGFISLPGITIARITGNLNSWREVSGINHLSPPCDQ